MKPMIGEECMFVVVLPAIKVVEVET